MESSEFGEPLLEADASFFLDVHAPLFVVMSGGQHGRDSRSDRASDQSGSIASTNLFMRSTEQRLSEHRSYALYAVTAFSRTGPDYLVADGRVRHTGTAVPHGSSRSRRG